MYACMYVCMYVCKVYMCTCVDTKQEEGTAGCGWSEWSACVAGLMVASLRY